MAKNTPFLKLIQTALPGEDLAEVAREIGIQDVSAKVALRVITEDIASIT